MGWNWKGHILLKESEDITRSRKRGRPVLSRRWQRTVNKMVKQIGKCWTGHDGDNLSFPYASHKEIKGK